MAASKTLNVVFKSTTGVAGEMKKPGTKMTLPEREANRLIAQGKAEVDAKSAKT